MDHFRFMTHAQMKAYAHYHNDDFKPRGVYTLPKPVCKDMASVYRSDYHAFYSPAADSSWYRPRNLWPYLVDTRRTIDPDFEVTSSERIKLSHSPSKSVPYASDRCKLNESNKRPWPDDAVARPPSVHRIWSRNEANRSKSCEKSRPSRQQGGRIDIEKLGCETRNKIPRLKRSRSVSDISTEGNRPVTYADIQLKRISNDQHRDVCRNTGLDHITHDKRKQIDHDQFESAVKKKKSKPSEGSHLPARRRPSIVKMQTHEEPDRCEGYQAWVKQHLEKIKPQIEKKVKPYEPRSTYADSFKAMKSEKGFGNESAINSRVVDSVRPSPCIPWHVVPSAGMHNLSRVSNTRGGRRLFCKRAEAGNIVVG